MEWFCKVPKVELHLHLEGSIPISAMYELVKKYQTNGEIKSLNDLEQKFKYLSFPHFLSVWRWKNNFIREYDDFTFIAEEVAKDLLSQNIRYAEVFFSPSDFYFQGLSPIRIAEAIRIGLRKINSIRIGLIVDLVRNNGTDGTYRVFEEIGDGRELGIIGIGLGGAEQRFPPNLFAKVYNAARQKGFYTTIHAGEAAGPESVWDAIKFLRPDRIGHGTTAAQESLLVEYLRENKIPIEMCPISNVKTKIITSVDKHPIGLFYRQGLNVTVNTDDPKMFGNSLAEEFQLLCNSFNFSKDDIRNLILNGIRASWLNNEDKRCLENEFIHDINW